MSIPTSTRLSRLLAWMFSSSVRGSLIIICSDHRSLSITFSRYSCTLGIKPSRCQSNALTQSNMRLQTYFTFSLESTMSLSCLSILLCWYSSLISRMSGQLLTGGRCGAEPPDLVLRVRPRPMSEPNGGPGLRSCSGEVGVSVRGCGWRTVTMKVTCTSVPGKSCQLRFLRLGGVMLGFCFHNNHRVQALWWPGFWMVMANSSWNRESPGFSLDLFCLKYSIKYFLIFKNIDQGTLCIQQRLSKNSHRRV